MEPVETMVAIALGVLAAVLLVTLSALVIICYRRLSVNHSSMFQITEYSPENILVNGCSADEEKHWSEFELDDVKLAPQIRQILNNTQWVDDVTGLIPHSLGILKLSHQLTERLLVPALAGQQKDRLHEVIQLSRRVSPRIDDVASAMYPPLDPRLLEARCCALVMALHLLVWHAHPTTSKAMQAFISETLTKMEKHLEILRGAAMSHEKVHRVFRDANMAEDAQLLI